MRGYMKNKKNKQRLLDAIPEAVFRAGFIVVFAILIITILMLSISEGAMAANAWRLL